MANKTNNNKNFFETMLDAQQQVVDTMVETGKKMANGNTILSETIEKGSEMFHKAVDATKETMEKVTNHTNTVKEEVKNSTNGMNEYFSQWQSQQKDWANQMMEMNKNFLSSFANPTSMQNPMQHMMNMWSNMGNMWNNPTQNPMQNMMNMMNPSSMKDNMDKATEQMKAFWGQFQNIMSNNYSEFSKNFENGTLMDSYKGMFNMADGFSKFYEMWMPMMKSMSEKTFNMDTFKSTIDMSKYKEFIDNYFSFMPKGTQEYMNNMRTMWTESMKNNNAQAKDMMNNMRSSMHNMMPDMFGNPFSSMLNNYNNMYSNMMNAVSPFGKLMTPTADTKTMQEWNHIINEMNVYNLKSAEMQYMVYQTGTKAMEKIAESVMHKIENGEEINSMMKLYQEWLNISDKMYVELFETDEYSQLMAEVSAMQLRIKKSVEQQQEKMFANVPVATRSEMDEVYKTIYELKKQVRQLQSMLELDAVPSEENTSKKTTSRKATK